MTSKTIEVPRELLERLTRVYPQNITDPVTIRTIQAQSVVAIDELRTRLAAPEAPRQEPMTMDGKTTIREYVASAVPEDWTMDEWTKGYEECKRRIHAMFMQPINSPLSPDHSGGGAGVVLPEPTPYQPKGEWSFERCEDGAIVIKNGKDWTVIKSGDGPIYEQFLYRFCEQQMKELTAPTINENAEFEKWRNTQIDVLTRNGYPEGAEAFRNLGSVQWAGWQARARLDKVKELNQ